MARKARRNCGTKRGDGERARALTSQRTSVTELDGEPVESLLEMLKANFDARFGGRRGAEISHPTDLPVCARVRPKSH